MPSQVNPVNTILTVTSVTANNTDMVASMDASNYRSGTIQVTSVGGGATIAVQFSLDNSTFANGIVFPEVAVPAAALGGITVTGLFTFNIPVGAFMRIRTIAYTSGTISANVVLSSLPKTNDSSMLYVQAGGSLFPQYVNGHTIQDGQNVPAGGLVAASVPFLMGGAGSSSDRQRGTQQINTLIASAARTTDLNSADQTNYNHKGICLILNVSAQSGGSVKLALQLKDVISSNYATIWTATAVQTAVGTYTYCIYPSTLDAASWTEKVQMVLGARTWRIATSTANGSSITYSVSAEMLL